MRYGKAVLTIKQPEPTKSFDRLHGPVNPICPLSAKAPINAKHGSTHQCKARQPPINAKHGSTHQCKDTAAPINAKHGSTHQCKARHGSSLADHPVLKRSLRQTNTSLRDKLNLSRSQNKVCSHAYNACSQLSRLHRMYHFQHTDIVFRQSRLFSSQFLSVDR